MSNPVKIACLQTRPMPDFESAITEATVRANQASEDASLLLLPEYCSGFKVVDGSFAPPAAPEANNPMLLAMQDLARERRQWIQLGSIAIPAGDKINNRGYLIDNKGNICSHYNKIHLFDIQLSNDEVYRESDIVSPGDELSVTDTPVGKLGHTICYDLRFPHLYRSLAQAGAEVLTIPAAFTRATGKAHWHALCRARAIENGAYVIAACAVGDIPGGGGSYGHSLVIDPWGEILADGGDEAGVVEATIDLSKVRAARAKIPSLTHDRAYGQSGVSSSREYVA
ncbi:MAG: carbon-nitrogen hydrolase family protein [Gammaproteobacteria bacterium]|nr:carbon-nitrogen hydrolase family protein [Gammaproteobacteria bacterium]